MTALLLFLSPYIYTSWRTEHEIQNYVTNSQCKKRNTHYCFIAVTIFTFCMIKPRKKNSPLRIGV